MACNSINNIAFDFVYLWFDVGRPVASKAEHPVRLIEMEKFDKNLGLSLCYYRVTYPLISVLSHHRTNISRVNGCSLRNTKRIENILKKHFFHRGPIEDIFSSRVIISDGNLFFWCLIITNPCLVFQDNHNRAISFVKLLKEIVWRDTFREVNDKGKLQWWFMENSSSSFVRYRLYFCFIDT